MANIISLRKSPITGPAVAATGSGTTFAYDATLQAAKAAVDGKTALAFIKDSSGMPLYGHVYRPASSSETDVRACFAAAQTMSGGSAIVDLRDIQCTLTLAGGGPIVPWHGLHVLGNWGRWFAPAVLDGTDIVVTDGTELICGESNPANKFNCFEYNAVDEPSAPIYAGGIPGFLQTALVGFKVEGVTFTGFKNGIKLGAKWKAGAHQCHFRNIHSRGCTEWGFYLENFQNCTGRDFMLIGNGLGQCLLSSANGTDASGTMMSMNYGNSRFENIFCNMGGDSNGLRRGMWIRGRTKGGELNDIYISKLQVNSDYGRNNSDTATLNPNTSSIVVGKPQLYEVGSHLSFDATAGGLKKDVNYVVRSKAGNVITVAEGLTDTTVPGTVPSKFATFVANAGTATNATVGTRCLGYPLLQISGEDGNLIAPTYIDGLDLENGGQSAIYLENAEVSISSVGYITAPNNPRQGSSVMASIVGRGAKGWIDAGAKPVLVDFDTTCRLRGSMTLMNGSSVDLGSGYGVKSVGIHGVAGIDSTANRGLTVGAAMVQLRDIGAYSLAVTDTNALRINETPMFVHRTKGSANESMLGYERTAITTLTGPNGTTYTLDQIQFDAGGPEKAGGDIGKTAWIWNATANPISVTLSASAIAAGQKIVGGGVSNTARTLPAYTGAMIQMLQTGESAGQCFYAYMQA
ncbi:MAG: hypothetical protein IIA02_10830 [Proteobacteria bacterium]|nr:hypothetical protein [Pseudomonadota bacterium]